VIFASWCAIAATLTVAPALYGSATRPEPALALAALSAIFAFARLRTTGEKARVAGWPLALLAAIGAFALLQALAGWTSDRRATLAFAARWLACAAIACAVAVTVRRERDARSLLVIVAAVGLAEASYGLLGWLAGWPSLGGVPEWGARGAVGTFPDRTRYAMSCVMTLFAGAALLLSSRSFDWRAAHFVGMLLCAAGIAASTSRGGMLSAAVGLVVLAAGSKRRAFAAVAAAVALAVLAWRVQRDFGRGDIFAAALRGFAERPFTGHGLGTFALGPFDHAHNEFLDAAYGGGIVVGAALVAVVVAAFVGAWRRGGAVGSAVAALVAAIAAHAMVDTP
jgi:O-antigen ligase